ncbi:MAG TPA: hypothetical protein VMF50_04410 [Candidatus Binataceae bacterium]|nr:hypothetical protein [Candidatus Binataceae bacterium]
MEVLDLKWTSVDLRAGLVRLEIGSNKSGAGRVLPFTDYSQLAEVIERRRVVAKRLAVAGVIAPWLFCFEKRPAASATTSSGRVGTPVALQEKAQ